MTIVPPPLPDADSSFSHATEKALRREGRMSHWKVEVVDLEDAPEGECHVLMGPAELVVWLGDDGVSRGIWCWRVNGQQLAHVSGDGGLRRPPRRRGPPARRCRE